ncbi:MAG: hypothetical protein IVW54_16940 [Candidatus Binataceae bacterium]|nr:hypothetical protein [Candidatus Binataceae bacterium]
MGRYEHSNVLTRNSHRFPLLDINQSATPATAATTTQLGTLKLAPQQTDDLVNHDMMSDDPPVAVLLVDIELVDELVDVDAGGVELVCVEPPPVGAGVALGFALTLKESCCAGTPPTVQTSVQLPIVSAVIVPLIENRPDPSVLPYGVVPLLTPF